MNPITGNVGATILAHSAAVPSAVAIRAPGEVCTYQRLAEMVARDAAFFDRTLPPREMVAIRVGNSVASVAALLGAAYSGRLAVLIPATLPEVEITQVWRMSGASHLALPRDDAPPEMFQAVWSTSPAHVGAQDALIAQLTSGSTGRSRLAVRSRTGVIAEILAVQDRLRLRTTDRILCASSIAHSYGLVGGLLAPLMAGAQVQLCTGANQAGQCIETVHPMIMFGLAGVYRAVLDREVQGLSSCRFALSAGAPLPAGLFDRFYSATGVRLRQDYGTTETGTICLDTADTPGPDDVGAALPHLELRIVHLNGVTGVARSHVSEEISGSLGEILVRGPAVAIGYLEDGQLLPSTDADGWYHTGDIGGLREGVLRLGGRLRENLRAEGISIAPEELERAALAMPGIRQAIAMQSWNAEGDPEIKLVVVAGDVTAEAVRTWSRQWFPHISASLVVELREALPLSPAGKILLKYLV